MSLSVWQQQQQQQQAAVWELSAIVAAALTRSWQQQVLRIGELRQLTGC
jgi:hypothetical protein